MVEFNFYLSDDDYFLLTELKNKKDKNHELTFNDFAEQLLHNKILEMSKDLNDNFEAK